MERGYAVASINYRYVNDSVHFPIPIIDCKDAVRWLHKNAKVYNIDENKIGLWGASAGAHLALMTAYSNNDDFVGDENLKSTNSDVIYIIDNFGPTKLDQLLRSQLNPIVSASLRLFANETYLKRKEKIEQLTGFTLKKKAKATEILKKLSPVNSINHNSVPTLIMHGDSDEIVPYEQSYILNEALKKYKVKCKFYSYKNAIHGFKNISTQEITTISNDIISFIDQITESND
ncbi:alpha/beta hydrolase [Flavobacterium agrisoli]|uniref:Alpha/beta hydrolase n=1 Tax=Flavobacterium agrisoli TaxID=2793066 RepID=A0A934PJ51_9FLAO|nr:alpha/beta hydrolase [Flavobacterium agrisoli]MBK0368335.1 alpha/beta hydrolase [Flavobacterium agrisoli]